MKQGSILAYSIPTSLLLFCWLTIGVSAAYDNDTVTVFGCPLSWYTPSLISSGGYEIAVGRFIADLAIYGLVIHLMWAALVTRVRVTPRAGLIFKSFLSIGAIVSILISVAAFSIDPHLTWWELRPPIPQNAARAYFVSVGLQPQRATREHE